MAGLDGLFGGLNAFTESQKGFQRGRNVAIQQEALENNRADRAMQLQEQERKLQEQELQRANAVQMQNELNDLSEDENLTNDKLQRFIVKHPSFAKQLQGVSAQKSTGEKEKTISELGQVYASLKNNAPEAAISFLEDRKEAAKNSGNEKAMIGFESMIKQIELNPNAMKTTIALQLAAVGGDDVLDSFKPTDLETFEEKEKIKQKYAQTPEEKARTAGLVAEAQAPYKSKGLSVTTPDGTVIQQGGQQNGNTNSTKSGLQGDIVGLEKSASDLSDISKLSKPEFLTYKYKAENAVNKFFDKLGSPIDRKKIGEYKRFQNNVKQFFNAYKKEITGSAAAVQEMQDIKDSLFSVDSSPTEFSAGVKQVQDTVNRHLRLKRKLLREGVSGQDMPKALDEAIYSGIDDDPKDRARDLIKKGTRDPKKIRAALIKEGYTFI